MGQISIVLIAGLIFLFSFEPAQEVGEVNQLLIVIFTAAVTFIPALLVYFLASYATRPTFLDAESQFRRLFLLKRAAIGFEVLILIGFVYDVYLLNLPLLVHQKFQFLRLTNMRQILSIVPLIVGLVLVRFALYEVERQVFDREGKRGEFLSFSLKLLLLPLFPLFIYLAGLDLIMLLPESVKQFFNDHVYLLIALVVCLILSAYIYAPLLLGLLWKSEPLANPQLKARLHRLAQRDGVKFKKIVVWQTGSLSIVNAAVAGIVPWARQIFLTDALLRHFSDDEIETVVAHEFGHIRYKHIPTYLIFWLTYFLFHILLYVYIGQPLEQVLPKSPILSSIGTIALFILYFVILFRYLSRRFEHQADLYAVRLTGNPEAFKSSLGRLAYLNYMPRAVQRLFEIFHTHPSIHRRIDFIDRFALKDSRVLRYQRYLFEVKVLILLIPVLVSLLFLSDLSKLG